MKYFTVAVLAIAVVCTVFADWDDYDDRICETDNDCPRDDCCVQDPRQSNIRACQDYGDDTGEPCGGPHFCDCDRGYICVPFTVKPVRRFRGFYHLANGTCQRDPAYFRGGNTIDGNLLRTANRGRVHFGSDSESDEHFESDEFFDRR